MKRIVGLYDHTGPGLHRIAEPLRDMVGNGFDILITDKVTEELLEEGFDVLFFNRVPPGNMLSDILKWHKAGKFKMVVDLDDHWELDPHHIGYEWYRAANLSNYILCAVIQADAVTVTHERLADCVTAYNRNVWVHPNAINPNSSRFQVKPTEAEKVRLFWAGSVTHEKDIAILRGPLRRVHADAQLREKIKMVMGGYTQNQPAWDAMATVYTNGLRLPGYLINGRPVEEYYSMYDLADICLVPLVASKFNSHKSNLKILEAAHHKLPVIVSDVHPYKDLPEELVNYVRQQPDWYKYIRHLVYDQSYRIAQGAALHEFMASVYNWRTINDSRIDLFKNLMNATVEH